MPLRHRRTLFDLAACRTGAMGGHEEVCGDCGRSRFEPIKSKYLLPIEPLSEVYRAVFLRLIRAASDAPELPPLDWGKPWVAHCRPCEEGPGNVLRYLARYTKRGPLPEKNILQIEEKRIVFRYFSHRTKRPEKCQLTPNEFLRRYLRHAPPSGFHRLRYYGLLAPGARRTLRGLRTALVWALCWLHPLIDEFRERLERHVPRPCPHCGGTNLVARESLFPNRRAPPWTPAI